ncbi:MAG: hypothetical protein WCA27_05525 [Candidatus Sulfotelmatobacter sp.]
MGKSGTVLLSVVVGVAAFVVATIWAGELGETLQKYQHAIDTWDRTDQSTLQASVTLGNVPPQGRDWTDQMSRLTNTEVGALGELFRDGVIFGTMPTRFGKIIDEEQTLDEDAKKVVTPDDAVAVGGKMRALIKDASTLGGAVEIFTKEQYDKVDKRRTLVKYGGYVLGVLAIIVAGIAGSR